MGRLEDTLAQGVKDDKIPHAVVFATNKDGSFTYKHAVGSNILGDSESIPEDAEFLLASQTKLLTSIAALQVVERGLFGLDDDVAEKLPELAEQPIIQGFDEDDKPILQKRKNTITFKHLLTHTSGCTYDVGWPDLIKLQQQRGKTPGIGPTVLERFTYPLVFEPGTGWLYGSGIDWAGKLLERVSGMNLDQWMQKNICEPLGADSITFFPYENKGFKDKVPALTTRNEEGKLILNETPSINLGSKEPMGGHGAYAKLQDYLKVQRSILANDGKLLKPETVDKFMFTPQLTSETKQALNDFRHTPMAALFIGENDPSVPVDWGIGGILFLKDDDGRRKKGTLNWGGMANTFWIIDREADLALTFGTQVLPPGDRPTASMITAVEKGVYEMAGVKFGA